MFSGVVWCKAVLFAIIITVSFVIPSAATDTSQGKEKRDGQIALDPTKATPATTADMIKLLVEHERRYKKD